MNQIQEILHAGVRKIVTHQTSGDNAGDDRIYKLSKHPTREFVFAVSGFCRYTLNGVFYDFHQGTVFLIDHWVIHPAGYSKAHNNLLHLWVSLPDKKMFAGLVKVGDNGKFKREGETFEISYSIRSALNDRWNMLSAREQHTDGIVNEYMLAPINLVLDEVSFQMSNAILQQKRNGADRMIENIKNYIRMRNGRDCSLEQLEYYAGYSKYHLAHRFTELEGVSIGAYIREVRLNYMKLALERGLKKKEIAYELGFSSLSNFLRWLNQ